MRLHFKIMLVLLLCGISQAAYEDFNDFTVGGANSAQITGQTSTKVTFTNLDNTDECICYKDYTADYFTGSFTHQFEIWLDNITNLSRPGFWALSNGADTRQAIIDASGDLLVFWAYGSGGNPTFHITLYEGGAEIGDDDSGATCSQEIVYYVTIARDVDANTVTATIRTTSHSGSVVDTLSISSGNEDSYRYAYAVQSWENGASSDDQDGYIQNLDINEEQEESSTTYPQVIMNFRKELNKCLRSPQIFAQAA